MQTFLPYRSFESSARVLDLKRLGKQRVENLQIMNALVLNKGWVHHPAVKMWKGHEFALMSYQNAICWEWVRRGHDDSCYGKTQAVFLLLQQQDRLPNVPRWLGLKKLHSSHRANLLRKDPVHYGRFNWKETPQEGYWWPTHHGLS